MSTVIELVKETAGLTADGSATITRDYAVVGSASSDIAVLDLRAYLLVNLGNPPSIGALVLDKISSTEEVQGVYFCTASWGTFARKSKPAEGESQFSFDIGLEPVKVAYAVGGITSFAAPGVLNWQPQLINDSGDGKDIEGVDVFEPTYNETETHWVKSDCITQSYRATLLGIVGHVNNAPFNGFQAGEVMFLGVSGGRRGATDSELSYKFACRPNQNSLTIGEITGIKKDGWDLVWPRYLTSREANSPAVQKVTHVAVAKVFPTANFSLLELGTLGNCP